jgi:hypothetical protein
MDPVTLAIALGLTGAGPIVTGIADATADRQAQQRNKAELEKLLGKEERGELGLDPEQRKLLDQQLNAPVQTAAAQARTRAEQIANAISGGNTTGQQAAQLRKEQQGTLAAGAQRAALAIAGAQEQAKQQQKTEIEQRLQAKAAYKRDDIAKILGPIMELAGKGGMMAGAPPGFAQNYGIFGTMYSPDELSKLQAAYQQDPAAIEKKLQEMIAAASAGGTAG